MPASNTASSYGTVTKVFHWVTALLILTVIPLGLIAEDLPFDAPLKVQLFSIHKTLGIIIFVVALGRILWALTQTKPGDLHPDRRVETMVAHIVHWLLYISLVAVPLTGWLHHAATAGFAPILLPIGQDLPFVPKSEGIAAVFAGLHWLWSKVMIVSILLHFVGALKHHLIDKDATLRRMMFKDAVLPETSPRHSGFAAPIIAVAIYAVAAAGAAATGVLSENVGGPTATLEAVASDWTVTDGAVAITITQLGNPVAGQFDDWTAAISFDPEATGVMGHVTATIAIGSLHLGSVSGQAMGEDFFAAETFPTATFDADITADGTTYVANGTLTVKGIAVPVSLPFVLQLNGDTATMAGSLLLDRRDFQVGQSMADATNLGFDVAVTINLSATRS